MVYQVRLSDEQIGSVRWEHSKKLLFGSLVCLSDDFFEKTCLVGVISDRSPETLRQGIIMVKFDMDTENLVEKDKWSRKFIMLEPSAFFESYKHVLKALISFGKDGEENFPFRDNLVYCKNKSMPVPKYLSNVDFDLRFDLSF